MDVTPIADMKAAAGSMPINATTRTAGMSGAICAALPRSMMWMVSNQPHAQNAGMKIRAGKAIMLVPIPITKRNERRRKMASTTVHVQYGDGSAASGIRVALSFATGGMTNDVRTNADGLARITHDGSGRATVFINGMRDGDTQTPGIYSATI